MSGLAVGQAQARVPDLAVHDADPAADAAALHRLARWAARAVSPIAAVALPDGLIIDATGLAHLYGGETALVARLEARMARLGFAATAAIAATPGAAHAIARHGGGVVAIGAEAARLATLPIAALRLPAATIDALARLGVRTIAELAALPRGPTARRFGAATLGRLDQALGRAPEPLDAVALPPVMAVRHGFAEPLATAEPLAEATRQLVHDLVPRLAAAGLGVRRLLLAFTRVDGAVERIAVGTAAARRDASHLIQLLLPGIETVDPGFGIEYATLAATLTEPLGARQLGTDPAVPDLAMLVDRLANRPEARSVHRVAARESDLPERSVAVAPPLAENLPTWPRLPRPPRLVTPPEPVEAMAMLPDSPPARFTWRGRQHRVTRADGPERLFGEWWLGPAEAAAVRDYYAVETESGLRVWLYRAGDGENPATGDMGWWLAGVFS